MYSRPMRRAALQGNLQNAVDDFSALHSKTCISLADMTESTEMKRTVQIRPSLTTFSRLGITVIIVRTLSGARVGRGL